MSQPQKSKVYFTKTITPEKLIEMYNKLDIKLTGNIGVKIHSGEKGNKNFLRPEFLKPIVDYLDGTIVETNTSCPEDLELELHLRDILNFWKNMAGLKRSKKL